MSVYEGKEGFEDNTEIVQEYEKGKTWECPCGQGIGTLFEVESVKCASCGLVLYDRLWEKREAPVKEDGQSTLGQWT